MHIEDVAELYLLAMKAEAGHFCFMENGEAAFRDMADTIGHALGLGGAESMAPEEAVAEWGRARTRLGWSPRQGSAVEWIREELVRA